MQNVIRECLKENIVWLKAYVAHKHVCIIYLITHDKHTNPPPHNQRCWLLNCELITRLMIPAGPSAKAQMISIKQILTSTCMQQQTMFTDNDFQMCSWADAVISTIVETVFKVMQSDILRIALFNIVILHLVYIYFLLMIWIFQW